MLRVGSAASLSASSYFRAHISERAVGYSREVRRRARMTRHPWLAANARWGKQVVGVRVRWLCATMMGLALVVSSCTAASGPSLPGGPAECANGVTEPGQASAALQRVRPERQRRLRRHPGPDAARWGWSDDGRSWTRRPE
jgi:hypothetical protein